MDELQLDVAVLSGAEDVLPVAAAAAAGGPVAVARHDHFGAVLHLSRCQTCDDGTLAADINVYVEEDGVWREAGGGGGDWDWPPDFVPESDVQGEYWFETPLPDGRRARLVPGFGPSGARLYLHLVE